VRALFLVGALGAGVFISGCSSAANRTEQPADHGEPRADGGDPPASRPTCDSVPVPEGQLQNRATGSSVFGQVVGDDPGLYDALGRTECGLPGVRVCRHGTEDCTESDEAGQFVLNGLPADQDTEISFVKAGHLKAMRLVHTGSAPINLTQTRAGTERPWFEFLEKAGTPQDPNLGLIVAIPVAAGEGIGGLVLPGGVVMTLDPPGSGPAYSAGSSSPGGLSADEIVPELTATHDGGWALFLNVVPGEYAVRFEREGTPCSVALPGYGYGANPDGSIRIKTFAGYVTTSILALCQ
jgi:hypothetical protein